MDGRDDGLRVGMGDMLREMELLEEFFCWCEELDDLDLELAMLLLLLLRTCR